MRLRLLAAAWWVRCDDAMRRCDAMRWRDGCLAGGSAAVAARGVGTVLYSTVTTIVGELQTTIVGELQTADISDVEGCTLGAGYPPTRDLLGPGHPTGSREAGGVRCVWDECGE